MNGFRASKIQSFVDNKILRTRDFKYMICFLVKKILFWRVAPIVALDVRQRASIFAEVYINCHHTADIPTIHYIPRFVIGLMQRG